MAPIKFMMLNNIPYAEFIYLPTRDVDETFSFDTEMSESLFETGLW